MAATGFGCESYSSWWTKPRGNNVIFPAAVYNKPDDTIDLYTLGDSTDICSIIINEAKRQVKLGNENELPVDKFRVWIELIEKDDLQTVKFVLDACKLPCYRLLTEGNLVYEEQEFWGQSVSPGPCRPSSSLALAACSRSRNILNYLLEHVKDISQRSCRKYGNVIHDLIQTAYSQPQHENELADVYDIITQRCDMEMKTLLFTENERGLRPLELAAHMDTFVLFNRILKTDGVYRFHMWSEGLHHYVCYDVTDYEILPARRRRSMSPLVMLSQTSLDKITSTETCNTIFSQVMNKWMSLKIKSNILLLILWVIFRFAFITLYMINDSNLEDEESTLNTTGLNITDYPKLTLGCFYTSVVGYEDVITSQILRYTQIFLCILILIFDIIEGAFSYLSLCLQKWKREHTRKSPAVPNLFYRVVQLAFVISVLTLRFARYVNSRNFMDAVSIAATLLCIPTMMFFMQLLPIVGHYVIIIQRMLYHMFQFLLVFFPIFFVFSLSFLDLLYVHGACDYRFSTVEETLYSTFQIMLDILDVTDIKLVNSTFVKILHVIFVLCISLLMLNFLIAVMTNAVNEISDHKTAILRLLRLDVSLLIESRFARLFRPYYGWFQRRYLHTDNGRLYIGCYEESS